PGEVVLDVAEVLADLGGHEPAADQGPQRARERPDGPLELDDLALEAVDAAGLVGALRREHRLFDLVDVLLYAFGDAHVVVDDPVRDRVQNRRGPERQPLRALLAGAPDRPERAVRA